MKTCSVDGCDKPHRARGLCVTHYNQQQPGRHRKVTVPCTYCGEPVIKEARSDGRKPFCDYTCRDLFRQDHPYAIGAREALREALPKYHMARWVGQSFAVAYSTCELCDSPIARDARQPSVPRRHVACRRTARFVAGVCGECRSPFVADRQAYHGHARFCSEECGRAHHRKRRRLNDRRPSWRYIAARQGHMRCHLCGDVCDPKDYDRRSDGTFVAGITYPSVDHVHPLAHGGSNDLDNLALAHMLCNALKSDTVTSARVAA